MNPCSLYLPQERLYELSYDREIEGSALLKFDSLEEIMGKLRLG
jgi:hypothetical protein